MELHKYRSLMLKGVQLSRPLEKIPEPRSENLKTRLRKFPSVKLPRGCGLHPLCGVSLLFEKLTELASPIRSYLGAESRYWFETLRVFYRY